MTRFAAVLAVLCPVSLSVAAEPARTQAEIDRDIRDYIAAITRAADENQHSCLADKWETDEELNADSGVTQEDVDRLLDPPQS